MKIISQDKIMTEGRCGDRNSAAARNVRWGWHREAVRSYDFKSEVWILKFKISTGRGGGQNTGVAGEARRFRAKSRKIVLAREWRLGANRICAG